MVDRVMIGATELPLEINQDDALVFEEEKKAHEDAKALVDRYGSIGAIPPYFIVKNGFGCMTRSKPTLYRPIKNGRGLILIDTIAS